MGHTAVSATDPIDLASRSQFTKFNRVVDTRTSINQMGSNILNGG